MTTILGLSGSLRRASLNSGLLRAAADVAPDGVTITIGDIAQVPLYDGDLEAASGIPAAVTTLTEQLAAADGLLLVSPEYNNGVPGVFKNVIDWMSRGPGMAAFKGKPVAVIGASPGGFGTAHAQSHWLPVLRMLGTRPWWDGRLMVARAGDLFDDHGTLTDDKTRTKVAEFVAGFAGSIDRGHS
ncbi:NADPH-dependent FMN reductase [Paracoccus sp. Ld10]|uniref:NADPH-dependent FMN reductase n=1 Tax=Paracoccus sp. Ld10 TaxID=649158 RepID=UPI0038659063